ncbi:hypothetical protein LTR70_004005 [Exophiala xenobiotica]|nr:hypothetical protein LTR70_004005 [Exophiala xenobiotica]
MLRGAQYNYFNPTLENERQRCANTLLRYNNACQLDSGVGKPEQQNMLRKVFLPSEDTTHSFVASLKGHEGSLGPSVRIEPGFDCTYGYNIKMYDSVFIRKNTPIDDSAKSYNTGDEWLLATKRGAGDHFVIMAPMNRPLKIVGAGTLKCIGPSGSLGSDACRSSDATMLPQGWFQKVVGTTVGRTV